MWPRSGRLGIAVSGGADSVCLLHLLAELRPFADFVVLHVNHSLRGAESDADEQFVRDLALSLGMEFHAESTSPAPGNLEQEARRARYQAFRSWIAGGVVERVATAHTADDQAETVLLRLLRGTGLAGLRGILPVTEEGIVRPMLAVRREQVVEYLRSRGLGWREDSTNSDTGFDRNRVRHELIPLLEREYNPGIKQHLVRLANLAGEDDRLLQELAASTSTQVFRPHQLGIVLQASELTGLPLAIARRVVRFAVHQVQGDLRGQDAAHIDQVLDLARSNEGTGQVTLHGLLAVRSFSEILLTPSGSLAEDAYRLHCAAPGRYKAGLRHGHVAFETIDYQQNTDFPNGYNENNTISSERLKAGFVLRNWRDGDNIQTRSGRKKIKDWFQEQRIPLWERLGWPVVESEASVVWTRGFGCAEDVRAERGSTKVIAILDLVD